MKKILTTSTCILAFAAYALYQYFVPSSTIVAANIPEPTNSNTISNSSVTAPIAPPPSVISTTNTFSTKTTPKTLPPKSTPTPTPVPVVKKNLYADGIFTGSVADAYYGNIQVQTTIQNGKIVDVQFLQYPSDRSTSRRINGIADPQLASEAISVQSANVDTISGASDSSQAFRESLSSALMQAKNS